MATYVIATAARSVRSSVYVSNENVENVVYAPRNPTAIGTVVVSGQPRSVPAVRTKPSRNEPVMLIPNVAHGNDRTPTATPIPYRESAPAAPANATRATFIAR